jgi:hypothetical protein
MLGRMSTARATVLVLSAALASASGCGKSEAPQYPSDDAGSFGVVTGGEAGAGGALVASGGTGARGGAGAENGGESGEGGVADGARTSAGGSNGRKPHTTLAGGKGGTATSGGSGGSGARDGEAGATAGGSSGGGTSAGGAGGAQGGSTALAGAAGAASAGAGGQSNQLSVCARLSGTSNLSIVVTNDFQDAVVRDCNINWLFYLYYDPAHGIDHLQDFMNQVAHFSLGLWGCSDGVAPTTFELVYGTPPLTPADASAVIDAYVGVAEPDLSLSPPERDAMRAVLERLSEPLVVSSELGVFSHSNCAGGAGGQGGVGGQGGSGGQTSAGGLGGVDASAGQGGAGQGDTAGSGQD